MTPAARLQAAIELLDDILKSARADGAAADTLIARYFKTRRYAGSKDRAAVRDMVYAVLRSPAVEEARSGRAAVIDYARGTQPAWLACFGAGGHAPPPIGSDEEGVEKTAGGQTFIPAFAHAFPDNWKHELGALLTRAPLFLRVDANESRADVKRQLAAENIATEDTAYSPWGLQCADDKVNIDATDLYRRGVIDVQDEGSQIVSLLSGAQPGETAIDLCAGAGGKTLALAAMMQQRGRMIAHDIDAHRLARLQPRAARSGYGQFIELRPDDLADLAGIADCVLVDAPCTGTGTWRRNPEARLRPLGDRLLELQPVQHSLVQQAATLVRPGGRIVYAVCSVLAAEGEGHLEQLPACIRIVDWRSRWPDSQPLPETASLRPDCLKLTPYRHGCDGFFIVCLEKL